jgi:hypothetical protein
MRLNKMPFQKNNEYRMPRKSDRPLLGRIDIRVPMEVEEKVKEIPGWQNLLREVIEGWANNYN